jgi:exopolysaccharide biosynthesis polyprenyl glycosylphosphotransferase
MAVVLIILESTMLFAAVWVTAFLTSYLLSTNALNTAMYIGQALTFTLCYMLSFYYANLYDLRRVGTFVEFSKRLPQSLCLLLILLVILSAVLPRKGLFSGLLTVSLLSLGVSVGLLLPIRGLLYAVMKTPLFTQRFLILGTGELAQAITKEIEAASHLRYTIVGFVDDGKMPAAAHASRLAYSILGPLEDVGDIIETFCPNGIIVALTERRRRLPVQELLDSFAKGTMVEDGVEVYERLTGKLAIENLLPSFLLFSKDFKKLKGQKALRRLTSVVIAVIGLILTAPLMGIIALAIKLDSAGPVFFVQDRSGLGGRTFRLVKFRSMHPAPGDTIESVWSRDVTSRLTRVGKWLRRFYFDELPQLINLLRGDMDLVGPRPEMAANVQTMAEHIPYYTIRNTVRPGITGWAQIKQGYAVSQEEVTEKMRYDLYYIKHMSLWLDLRILLDTMKIVLSQRGT